METHSRLPISSRFLQTTESASVRQRQRPDVSPPRRQTSTSSERKLTIPVAPKLRSVSRSRDRVLSTEEREQQLIEEEKRKEIIRMKKNKRSMEYNKAKSSMPVHNVIRSTKPLTIPNTPFNHLSKRHGEKKYSTTFVYKPEVRPKSAPATGPKTLTQPEPFNLRTEARGGAIQPVVETVLTAGELCRRFEADPRSHRVPASSTHLTEAMSPKLSTKLRASSTGRPKPKSREEVERETVEEASKHQFKARPVDKRIFSSLGELGVPKVAARPVTTCEEFTFHYNEDRVMRRQQSIQTEDHNKKEIFDFKATPMPDFSAPCPSNGNAALSKPLTIAISPKLNGGRRASSAPPRRQLPHHNEVGKVQQKRALEERERAARPLKLTEPEGFHLSTDDRGQAARALFTRKLLEEIKAEKEKRNFKASQLKINQSSFVPHPSTKELTDFREFHLQSDYRHALAASKKQKEDDLRASMEQEVKNFHARPVPKAVTDSSVVFKPQKEQKPLTRPESVHFASDDRMRKRKLFEKELARKRKAQADYQSQLELERAKNEQENVNMLRRKPVEEGGFCFKAAPVMCSKSLAKKATSADITAPKVQNVLVEKSQNILV